MAKARRAKVKRKTKETDIQVSLNIDGQGKSKIDTGIGFLDHMLELFAKHGLFDLEIKAKGDLKVDIHHTNEDVGRLLGEAFNKALGKKVGIRRFGEKTVPMDEALVRVVIDISGRASLNRVWSERIFEVRAAEGGYSLEDARHFLDSFVKSSLITMHISILTAGSDPHHLLEAIFKAAASALDEATQIDPRRKGIPSTKGRL